MSMQGAIAMMAKWPVTGHVKTRLQPILRQAGCVALARFLIQRLAIQLHHSQQNWMVFTEGGTHKQWSQLLIQCLGTTQPSGFLGVVPQVHGHLGLRIQYALQTLLVQHEVAAVVGADAVQFEAHHVRELLHTAQLHPNQVVFVPAHDGGYVAMALTRKQQQLHALCSSNIQWGSVHVLQASIHALAAYGQPAPILLPAQADVDEATDLVWLNGMHRLKALQ